MNFKKVMLVAFLLLALIMIGTVSAHDDISSDNLTVDDGDSIESSVNNEDLLSDGDNQDPDDGDDSNIILFNGEDQLDESVVAQLRVSSEITSGTFNITYGETNLFSSNVPDNISASDNWLIEDNYLICNVYQENLNIPDNIPDEEGLNGHILHFAFYNDNNEEILSCVGQINLDEGITIYEPYNIWINEDDISIISEDEEYNTTTEVAKLLIPLGYVSGYFVIGNEEKELFRSEFNYTESELISDDEKWYIYDEYVLICPVYLSDLNISNIYDGDELIFGFSFYNEEEEEYLPHGRFQKDRTVSKNDENIRFNIVENDDEVSVSLWDESDERGPLYTDSEGDVVGIDVPRNYEGVIFRIYVNDDEKVSWEAEFDDESESKYNDWGLEELEISEAGDYNIVVESYNGEDREILLNKTITVSQFNEDSFRAMILYASEVIKFYTPANAEGTIKINTKKEIGDDEFEEVFDESYEITDEYKGNWKEFALADIGFEADGAFRIFTITVTNAEEELYYYKLAHVGGEDEEEDDEHEENVELVFNTLNEDGDMEFNKTSNVLVAWLYIPDGEEHEDYANVSATVYVSLNGELIKTVKTSDFTELDRPNYYPIILDLSDLNDKDILTFHVDANHNDTGESAIDEEENEWMVIVEDKGDSVSFHDDVDFERLEFSVFAGNLTLGTTNNPDLMGVIKDNLVIITISDALDITEGTITVKDGETTLFTKQLSECEKKYDYGSSGYGYYISLDEVKNILPEGVNLTVSFNYADNTLSQKRIRFEDYLYKIVTSEDINKQYIFDIEGDLMLHENDTAIYLFTDTNRQAIYFDLGGGYFTIYVNGVKVENLGNVSFNTWMNKGYWRDDDWDYIENYAPNEQAFLNHVASYWGSELELFRLTSWNQGAAEMEITLADLGINESGTYNIRITHYPSVPGGPDDHSELGIESSYVEEMIIPTLTEVLDVNITCNFDPDYAGVNIYPVTLYGNGIPFLFTFYFGDNITNESNSVMIYIDGELAFNSTILYYDENDEGEMELCKLWIVGPEMLSEDLFDECGFLDVGEYEAVVYLVKGDENPIEIGRGNFSRIKQRGNMNFTIGSSVEDDGIHTIIYADIPEGNWTDYTLEINIAHSESVYRDGLWEYWFNEYVIFKDNQIYSKDSLDIVIGKGPVAIDLGVLDEGTQIFVALEHGEETVFGDWDFYHNAFIVVNKVDSFVVVSPITFDYGSYGSSNVNLTGAVNYTASISGHEDAINISGDKITVSGLDAGVYTLVVTTVPDANHNAVSVNTTVTVKKVDSSVVVSPISFDYGGSGSSVVNLTGAVNYTASISGYADAVNINDKIITVSNLPMGNYTLVVTTVPDANHNAVSVNTTVTVNKSGSSVVVSPISFDYGGSGSSVVNLTGAVNYTASITGHDDAITINGNEIIISGLDAGSYILSVTTIPDEGYDAVTVNTTVTVNKIDSSAIVNDIEYVFGDSGSSNVNLTGAVNYTASISGYADAVIINGNVITVSNLPVGTYTLVVTTVPDANHKEIKTNVSVTVKKVVINNDNINKYIENGVLITDIDDLTFEGEFTNINLTINKSVTLTGQNAIFTNAVFKITSDNVVISNIVFNYDGDDSVISINGVSNIKLENNTIIYNSPSNNVMNIVNVTNVVVSGNVIRATGKDYIRGIFISADNFTISNNEIIISDVENACGINILGPSSGIVGNNILNLNASKTIYSINTNPSTGSLQVSYIDNSISAKAYFVVGIYDDSEVIKGNSLNLEGNYSIGIVVLSNANIEGNEIVLNTSNVGDENISEAVGVESTGIKVNNSAVISNNNINSTSKSISIAAGNSTISGNELIGSINVASNGNKISGNVISTTEEFAIDLTNSTGNNVNSNEFYSNETDADKVINAGEGNNVFNNYIKSSFDITNDMEFDYNRSANTTVTNLVGVKNITASVVNHTEAIVSINDNVITVSNLNAGNYILLVTSIPEENYSATNKTVTITVNKLSSKVVITPFADITYGNVLNASYIVINETGVSASVINRDSGVVYTCGAGEITDNNIIVAGLAAGNYTLVVCNDGNENISASSDSFNFTIYKASSSVTIKSVVNGTYKVIAPSITPEVVNETTLYYNITSNGVEVASGYRMGLITVLMNLNAGAYNITFTNLENENYTSSSGTAEFSVYKANSSVVFSDNITFDYKSSGEVNVTVIGGIIALGNISVDGHPEAIISLNNGVITVSNLTVGEYTLNVTTTPDVNHLSVKSSVNVKVNKIDSSVEFSNSIVFVKGNSGSTTITVVGGKVVLNNIAVLNHSEANITLKDNVITVSNLSNGSYILNVITSPDEGYNSVSANVSIIVSEDLISPDFNIIIDASRADYPVVVNVTAVNSFNGDVIVNINGTNVSVSIVNGFGSNQTTLTAGTYNAVLNFTANNVYSSDYTNTTFKVKVIPVDPNLVVSAGNVDFGSPVVVYVSTNTTFSGNVSVKVGSDVKVAVVVNGEGKVRVMLLSLV